MTSLCNLVIETTYDTFLSISLPCVPNIKVGEMISSEIFFENHPKISSKKGKVLSIEHRFTKKDNIDVYTLFIVVEMLKNSDDE